MARPYVSHKKLCDNSRAAMLAAIEVYNKPQTTYREQVVTVLVVNAWELILKAALRKSRKNIFYKKKRGEDYRSFSLERCLADMEAFHLWPDTVDGDGVRANLHVLTASCHHAQRNGQITASGRRWRIYTSRRGVHRRPTPDHRRGGRPWS